jgi:ABC-type nitrate/sulfonate/bicarbonate transport system substrate-binding protein
MKRLKRILVFAPGLLLTLFCINVQAKNIVIATSSVVLTNVPIWVGIDKKFFEEYGLAVQYMAVQYIVMRSDLAVKGLITGDVDYMQSASSVLRAAVAGAPLVTVFGTYNRTFFRSGS